MEMASTTMLTLAIIMVMALTVTLLDGGICI